MTGIGVGIGIGIAPALNGSGFPAYPLNGGNLLTAPDDMSNGAWTPTFMPTTANARQAPDGTMTADLLIPGANASLHLFRQGTVSASGTTMTFEVFAKAEGYTFVGIREDYATGNSGTFTLSGAGTAVANAGSGGGTASITQLAGGWYKLLYTTTTTAANLGIGVYVQTAAVDPSVSGFTGDGVSGVAFWHVQAYRP